MAADLDLIHWRRMEETRQFLQELVDRFPVDRQWSQAPVDKIPRLQGQKEVLEWIEGWLNGR